MDMTAATTPCAAMLDVGLRNAASNRCSVCAWAELCSGRSLSVLLEPTRFRLLSGATVTVKVVKAWLPLRAACCSCGPTRVRRRRWCSTPMIGRSPALRISTLVRRDRI